MLKTFVGASEDAASVAYLRAETCQAIFIDFKRVRETARQKIPFGIAQIGKAFRNEINPRNFTFRSREFEQAELEFFVHPSEREQWFELLARRARALPPRARLRRGPPARAAPRAATSWRTTPRRRPTSSSASPSAGRRSRASTTAATGTCRATASSPARTSRSPTRRAASASCRWSIETSVGVDRTALALLCNGYGEETLEDGETRTVLGFHPLVAPIKVAVLPLSKKLGRAGAAHPRATCAALGTSSTTRPATSAGATAARTRSARRSASPTTSSRSRTARSRCASATRCAQERIAIGARAGLPARAAGGAGVTAAAKRRRGRSGPRAEAARRRKRVYFFGDGKADGRGDWKELLGGKGANLAEMTRLGIPVPPGFTISTEVCAEYEAAGGRVPASREARGRSRRWRASRRSWARASATRRGRCSSRCARARAPRCRA